MQPTVKLSLVIIVDILYIVEILVLDVRIARYLPEYRCLA
jgi:hypothetical protein